jgi:hypothetical protein
MIMLMFVNGSDASFRDLERRATGACVVFPSQPLPPGCSPPRARVGVEMSVAGGPATLYVDRGIAYGGSSADVAEWLAVGSREFSSFDDLVTWIRQDLAACFREAPAQVDSPPFDPNRLTDVDAVRVVRDRSLARPIYDEADLFERLSARVRGQDGALRAVSACVSRHAARVEPRRPATLFALGPTGVGKTETARALPEALAEIEGRRRYDLLRLDMCEYHEAHRVSQLLGSPQGYVGYGDGARLVDTLASNPETVVLFDEIEKAHPSILKVLMNAMDAGRLSTATAGGREIDCRKSIFFFTSNARWDAISRDLTRHGDAPSTAVVDEICRDNLRAAGIGAELVARIGRFLVYRPLSERARIEALAMAIARVGREYGLDVTRVEPEVIENMLETAGAMSYGVRPDEYLADAVLGGEFARAARSIGPRVVVSGPPVCCLPADAPVQGETEP